MTAFLFIIALSFACGLFYIQRLRKRTEALSTYVKSVEDERNTYRREMSDLGFQNQILVAKLEQIDKVLTRLGVDSVRARIQPFLLSVGAKNGTR